MLYPSDRITVAWEISGSIILLGTCILTPFTLAFNEELDQIPWYTNLNYAIDIFFFFDIIINFNMAQMNDQYVVLSNRKEISCLYLQSWFLIDLLSIIPFELVVHLLKKTAEGGGEDNDIMVNKFARVARVSKLYKLVKITRLIKIMKMGKYKKKIGNRVTSIIKFGAAFERLLFFLLTLLLVCHLIGCMWIYVAKAM